MNVVSATLSPNEPTEEQSKSNPSEAKMSVSAVLGSQFVAVGVPVKNPSATASFGVTSSAPWLGSTTGNGGGGGGLVIECSSRPQKKATAHHRKTRPRKTQPWDIKRKPTVYAPLPSLPAEWTLLSSADEAASASSPEESSSTE